MEGFPCDYEVKGGFKPIRIQKLVITCPRPPKSLEVTLFGRTVQFHGEFSNEVLYDNNTTFKDWEDVNQIIERIRESGGKLVAHARRHPIINGHLYEDRWEYTSVNCIDGSAEADVAAAALDSFLGEINMDPE